MKLNSQTKRTAGAVAVLYLLLVVGLATLSGRVVFGILVAVPITISLALNYALVRSSRVRRRLGEPGYRRLVAACWAIQTTLITLEVMTARRVPVWLSAPLALLCGGLAATGYTRWRSPTTEDNTAAQALAAADAKVLAESETAGRTHDDRPYADAIVQLHQVVTQHPDEPGGQFLLHSHRAQYLTFQAGITAERIARAAPADRPTLEDRMHTLYTETEAELRAAITTPPGPGRTTTREHAALGLLLCLGAEQGGPNRTTEGIRLLRKALAAAPALDPEAQARIQLDMATALIIRSRLNNTPTDRQDAKTLLRALTEPTSPVAAEAQKLQAELAAEINQS